MLSKTKEGSIVYDENMKKEIVISKSKSVFLFAEKRRKEKLTKNGNNA